MSENGDERIVRAALVKAEVECGKPRDNITVLEGLAGPLAGSGIDVLVTPECFLDGYMVRGEEKCSFEDLAACAVAGPHDALIQRVKALSKLLKSYIVFGASEQDSNGVLRNVAYLFDRDGKHVGTYYKIHAGSFYRPGEDLFAFKTDFGLVGVVICADRRWPENIRVLRLKGVEVILNPTWGFYGDTNTAIMRTRAYENGIPICFAHPKQSLICLADGKVGAVLESNVPGVLVYDIDLASNHEPEMVKSRRPELYKPITEEVNWQD